MISGLAVLRGYRRAWLPGDLLAGRQVDPAGAADPERGHIPAGGPGVPPGAGRDARPTGPSAGQADVNDLGQVQGPAAARGGELETAGRQRKGSGEAASVWKEGLVPV